MANLKNTTVDDSGFLRLPVGDTAARPGSPNRRQIRFNTETGKLEQFRPGVGDWIAPNNTGVIATGGDSVYDIDAEGTTYRVHVFTSTGTSTFEVLQGGEAEYLIVAGGGAGGLVRGGGGGAGGLISGITALTAQSYTITVGAGGSGGKKTTFDALDNAENSSAFGLVALGGGVGGRRSEESEPPSDGGSGGGEGGEKGAGQGVGIGLQPTSTSGGFGNNGGTGVSSGATYSGGGGGGAGGNGKDGIDANGGNGGVGLISFLAGTPVFYSGGGGGHSENGNPRGEGGLGGGGFSGIGNDPVLGNADSGTANTGGGGGGGGYETNVSISGDGGSGIVIVRYLLRQENPVTAAGRDVRDGLVLDLDFAKPTVYNGSGSVVTDSRLNGIEGTFINTVNYTNARTHRSSITIPPGPTGTSGNILEIPRIADPSPNPFTILLVARASQPTPSGSFMHLIDNLSYNGDTGIHSSFARFSSFTGQISFRFVSGSSGEVFNIHSSTNNLDQGNWFFATYCWDGSTQANAVKLYINGVLETVTTSTLQNSTRAKDIRLGAGNYTNGTAFRGDYGIFRIYNRVLEDQEILEYFNATRWRFGV